MASVRPFFMPGIPVQEPEGMTPNRFFSQLMEAIRAEGGEATPERVIPLLLGLKEPQPSIGADAFGVGLGEVTTPPTRTSPEKTPPSSKPNGPAAATALRRAAEKNSAMDKELQNLIAAEDSKGIARAMLAKEAADKQPTSALGDRYREFLASQKLDVPDPMHSRTVSDAVLTAAGQWLASQGRDIGGGVAKGVEAWKAGRNRDEDQAEKKLERQHKQFLTALGFDKEDAASLLAKQKAVHEANMAGVNAASGADALRLKDIEQRRKEALEWEKIAVDRAKVGAINATRQTPAQVYQGWVDLFVGMGKPVEAARAAAQKMMLKKDELKSPGKGEMEYFGDLEAQLIEAAKKAGQKLTPEQAKDKVRGIAEGMGYKYGNASPVLSLDQMISML